MKEKMTWSPRANSLTPSPTSSTTPAPSWPSTSGSGSAMVPLIAERSEWHTPQAPRRTSTSPRLGASTLISSTWTGLLCSRQRTALALRGIARAVYGMRCGRIKYSPCLESPMLSKEKLFIGGQWIAPSGRESIDVHNAGNGEVMGRIPAGGEKDVDAAVRAARGAFEAWAGTSAATRADYL